MGNRNVDFEWNRDEQRWEFLYLDMTVDPPKHSAVYIKPETDLGDALRAMTNWFKMILRDTDGRS